ncbi:MAG: hypothetical protein DLM71_10385 [Chloroflexi bacterium]|nr:MAG: hypothetical protein DLM71_10385 [Chloroflexota bacterium]
MRVLILGATGRIGRLALARALADGHDVVALTRHPQAIASVDHLRLVPGDVTDPTAVSRAVAGVECVLAAIGPHENSADAERSVELGARNLVAAMEHEGIRRIVTLSGAAVDSAGDRKPMFDQLASRVVRVFARHVVGAKQREYEVIAATSLAWTALRPPLVSDGSARGYRLELNLLPGARVRRADIADALVDQLTDSTFLRQAPFVLPVEPPARR